MSVNNKLNIEGATYVIPGEDDYNPAEIKSSTENPDWNDFSAYDNESDYEYVKPENVSQKQLAEILKRAKKIRLGGRRMIDVFNQAA